MKNHTLKKQILVCSLLLTFIVIFTGCKKSNDISNLETEYMHPMYIMDMNIPEEVVGISTNVFIGYIEEYVETSYDLSIPYTRYNVKVLSNIKGEIPLDSTIEINKEGGISEDLSYYLLNDKDTLPNVNEYYVFNVRQRIEDGSYVASGINTVVLIDDINIDSTVEKRNSFSTSSIEENKDIEKELENSDVYNKYLEAFKNQIEFDPNNFR